VTVDQGAPDRGAPEQGPSHDGATVAAYDIARLAGVGRAAVSNWRRRYPDFPEPVAGSAASPLYQLSEVEAWLARNGKQFRMSPGDRVWQRIRGTVEDLRLGDLAGQLGTFLLFLRREPQRWRTLARRGDSTLAGPLSAAVGKAVPDVPGAADIDRQSVGIMRVAAEAAGDGGHREVFDFVCDRYLEVHARRRRGTTAPVAELMVALAGARKSAVLDPACGAGTLLLSAHTAGAAALLGQEADPVAARLAAVRLLLHDAPARVAAGDSLRADAFPGEQVRAVVCNPPFHDRGWGYDELTSDPRWEYGLPPRGEPELAWVQHCLAHVTPGGWVAIMMPATAASRRAGRRIRGNLLRRSALRAVITLPGGGPGSAGAPDLWLLRRPAPDEAPVSSLLLVSAADDLAVTATAWRAFQDGRDLPDGGRAVRIIDLLDDEVDLSPSRHLVRPAADLGASFRPAAEALRALAERLTTELPDLEEVVTAAPVPQVSLGELVRAGAVVIHQAPLKMVTETGPTPVLTARDVRHGGEPTGRTEAGSGVVTIEPGDVVTPVAFRDPVTLVIADGDPAAGAAVGPQLYLLRVEPEQLDPHFLAGFLRVAHGVGHGEAGHRGGSLSSRSDVHRVTLPRLSLADQRRYGEAFRQLMAFEDTARQVSSLAGAVMWRGLAGLAAGNLRPAAGGH
jgi:hypothetical protein